MPTGALHLFKADMSSFSYEFTVKRSMAFPFGCPDCGSMVYKMIGHTLNQPIEDRVECVCGHVMREGNARVQPNQPEMAKHDDFDNQVFLADLESS